jgi:hypothetical protein
MNKILHIIGDKYNILISKGAIFYKIILEEKKSSELYTLICIRSKGKTQGVYVYYVINSLKFNSLIDFACDLELVISYTNGPSITVNY